MRIPVEIRWSTFACVAAVPVCVALLTSLFPLMEPLVEKDSRGYMMGEAYRGVIYPLFLDLFELFPKSLKVTAIAQTFIFAAAATFMAYSFARAVKSKTLGITLAVLLMFCPTTYFFNNAILTESLYQSALCIFLGSLAHLILRKDWLAFVFLGLGAGLMMITRPVGIAILPVMVVSACAVYLTGAPKPWRGLVLGLACALSFVAIERVVYTVVHGNERESVLANVLFAKSGVLEAGESPYEKSDPRTTVWNFLEYDEAEEARRAIDAAPAGNISYFMLHSYEADMLFAYKDDELKVLAAQQGISQRNLMKEVGADRIARNLGGFLLLAAQHYWATWQPFYYATAQNQIDRYVETNSPLPMRNASNRLTRDIFLPPAPRVIHLVLALGWLFSVGLVLSAAALIRVDWAGRDLLTLSGLGALIVHGQVLTTSMFSIASVRYLAVLWPAVALASCAVMAFITNAQATKRQNT